MNWKEEIAELIYLNKAADDAVQIEKDLRRQKSVERLVKKTQDGTLEQPTVEPMDNDDYDDTVRVGHEYNNHYHQAPAAQPQKPQGGMNGLARAALIAGALGATGGTAALGTAALGTAAYVLTRPQPQSQVIQGKDTNTKYRLGIYREGDKGQQDAK